MLITSVIGEEAITRDQAMTNINILTSALRDECALPRSCHAHYEYEYSIRWSFFDAREG